MYITNEQTKFSKNSSVLNIVYLPINLSNVLIEKNRHDCLSYISILNGYRTK